MASLPPPLPGAPPTRPAKNLRAAGALNFFLPGAGLFYLGRRVAGAILAGTFLTCFVALLGIFLVGYARYLSIAMSDDLLQGNKLEEAGAAFPRDWLLGLALAGGVIYLVSAALFARAKRQTRDAEA